MGQQPIPIPYEGEDEPIHTNGHPFCEQMSCPCHEESEFMEQVQIWVADGLITTEDAERIYRGQTLP